MVVTKITGWKMISFTRPVSALAALILFIALLVFPSLSSVDELEIVCLSDDKIAEYYSECTTGMASGLATPDGRPLLWKNRDVGEWQQEYHYVDDGRIPFISVTYRDTTDNYYGGLNAAGFAIENSDAHNLLDENVRQNGWGGDPDDGETMYLALATCRTVDDFQSLLDSLNIDGRTDDFNYGVIDAFGGASMFECDSRTYTRFDAVDEEYGFMIRANFSYTGSDTTNNDSQYGIHRHDRAYMLWKEAYENGNLTPRFVYQQVVRDLSSRDCDPYPLPFDGYYTDDWGTDPYGCVRQGSAINRDRTRSVLLVQGVRDGERPDDAVIWAMVGNPIGGIVTPLWVRSGNIPREYDSVRGASLCELANNVKNEVITEGLVDTWRLCDPEGRGYYDFILPVEDYFFEKTERFLNSPAFSYDRLAGFQAEIAQEAADSIATWKPTLEVTERFEAVFMSGSIHLVWGEPERDWRGERINPRGYSVYRSDQPFRENDRGEFLATVENTEYIDNQPLAGASFYRIETLY